MQLNAQPTLKIPIMEKTRSQPNQRDENGEITMNAQDGRKIKMTPKKIKIRTTRQHDNDEE